MVPKSERTRHAAPTTLLRTHFRHVTIAKYIRPECESVLIDSLERRRKRERKRKIRIERETSRLSFTFSAFTTLGPADHTYF